MSYIEGLPSNTLTSEEFRIAKVREEYGRKMRDVSDEAERQRLRDMMDKEIAHIKEEQQAEIQKES